MVRLLKVIVQPIFVTEDGDELRELPVQPVQLSATEWKTLDPKTWAKEGTIAIEKQVDAQAANVIG